MQFYSTESHRPDELQDDLSACDHFAVFWIHSSTFIGYVASLQINSTQSSELNVPNFSYDNMKRVLHHSHLWCA